MSNSAKPSKLYARLRAVHQREQGLHLLMGLMALAGWGIVIFLLTFAVDWLVRLPGLVRWVTLVLLWVISFKKAWRLGWQFLQSLSLADSALKVEHHYQNLKSLLVTGVQLSTGQGAQGTSLGMSEETIRQADEAVASLDARAVVPFSGLRKPASLAALLCAVLCAFALCNAPLLKAGLSRIFMPWQSVSYPTRTHLTLDQASIVVKEGDPVLIRARLSGEIPRSAKMSLRTGEGKPRKRKLDIVDSVCEYGMAAVFRSFDYSIRAGDADSGWQTVEVITSPRVTRTQIRLVYPDYMGRPPETMEAMTLAVPEGARMEWHLQLDRAVSAATFKRDGHESMPLTVSDDGLSVTHIMDASASAAYSFSWVEKAHEFSFDTAKHYLQVTPDQPPRIELTSPQKNLFATVGRTLELAYRTRDDHGLGDAHIVYRLNNATEQRVAFTAKPSGGRSVQTIDWDYRKALVDLSIGDSVTFALEVSDRYPEPEGPHRVRSESRRVSFLSEEDYLTAIQEQKERLLSQLRAVYRQERAAYAVIRALDPEDDAFEQTCFLESSRQDILAERITLLSTGISELIADLTANKITDKAEFEGLNALQLSLEAVSRDYIAEAAAALRDLGPARNPRVADVTASAETINNAARDLGSLVLQLGVDEAMEVFAQELHVIAETQSALRAKSLESEGAQADLSAQQKALAAWISRLLTELSGQRDYSKSPLTIVRLARMVKDLRNAGIADDMYATAQQLADGHIADAADRQTSIIDTMFVLECHIRVGSEYEALLNARELFSRGVALSTAEADRVDMSGLYRGVRLLILPDIPAPQPGLLSKTPSDVPPVDALLVTVQDALQKAAASLQDADLVRTQQERAAGSFRTLHRIVETRIAELTKTSRYAGNSGASMDRASMIRELVASQMRLTEKTEDADYDETSGVYLAPSQLHLNKDVLRMRDRLERKNRKASARSPIVVPMLKKLEEAADAMTRAAPALEKNDLIDAIDHQDVVLDALQAAQQFANHDAGGWLGLANLLMTAEGIALPAKYMRDVVEEQRDLIAATQKSTPESRPELLAIQSNLGRAVLEVSALLEGTGSALDFEQAMIFAGSDMGSSALKLEAGDVPGAIRAQRMAVESVSDLSRQFTTSEKQFYYFVTVLEFLQKIHTDGVVLQDRIGKVRGRLEEGVSDDDALKALAGDVDTFCSQLLLATGRTDYGGARDGVNRAVAQIADPDLCLDELMGAGDALNESLEELRELVAKVAYIPSVEPIEAPPEYNVMMEMVDVLRVQQRTSLAVYRANDDTLAALEEDVQDIGAAVGDLLMSTDQHAFIVESQRSMVDALKHLKASSRVDAYAALRHSAASLRHCILEYVLYYVEIKRPGGSKRKKKGKSGIVTMFKMSNKLRAAYDKDWGGVEGEDPKSGRAEWEVLGRRDRAALNENFVRELPLEYREFLKDYYERLTK